MRFITIFPKCENIHLVKDVGMVPFILHKFYNFKSTIASYDNGDYSYLENEVKGLNQVFIRKRFNSTRLNVLFFILQNFKKYDVLQVYHFSIDSLIFLTFFRVLKIFDNRTKTYLKLDADDDILKIRLRGILGYFAKKAISKISLISVETKILFIRLKDLNVFGHSLIYLPNGFYDYEKKKKTSYSEKKNIFITVGRNGTYQKATEVLLEAFRLFAKKNISWDLQIVGSIEDSFLQFIEEYFIENPELRNRINFTGVISNRDQLNKMYDEAKIFLLTSRYESFGLVYLEAMSSGCTVISTKVTPAFDITDNDKIGRLVEIDDSVELSNVMLHLVNDDLFLEVNSEVVKKITYDNYYWPKVLAKVNDSLKV